MIKKLTQGFLNTTFYGIGMIQTKLDDFCGSTINTIENRLDDNHLIVTMTTKPYYKVQKTKQYLFRTAPSLNHELTKIVEIREI